MKKVWLTFVLALAASAASAQSTGTVQVRIVDSAGRPLDGTVTFRSGNASASCRTVASRCSIALVPGTWSADVAPTRERSAGALQVAVTAGAVANVTFRTQAASTPTATATVSPTTTTATTTVTTSTATPTTTTNTPTTTRTAPTVVRSVPNRATRDGRLRNPTPTPAPTVGNVAPVSTQPTVSPTVRSATATPIVRSTPTTTTTTTTPTTPTATTPTATTPTATTPTRDLGRGARVCAQGNVIDAAGRPADATLTVSRDGATLGTVRSVAGRFSMFDLPPGRYALRAVAARDGSVSQQSFELGPDVARVVVRLR